KLDQGGQLGFQLDVLGSVLVGSHSLDEMTQAQSFDELQIHFANALWVDVDEFHQVGGRDVRNAGQNLVGSHGSRRHAGIDGCPNRSLSQQSNPLRVRSAVT